MKMDIELFRKILLLAEDRSRPGLGAPVRPSDFQSEPDAEEILGHINLLVDAGYMEEPTHTQTHYYVGNVTFVGHEFLNSVRDPEIWNETKTVAKNMGSWTLDLLSDLAKGLIKTKIKQHTGVEL